MNLLPLFQIEKNRMLLKSLSPSFDFNALVLTSGLWPFPQNTTALPTELTLSKEILTKNLSNDNNFSPLPNYLEKLLKSFSDYYLSKHTGRNLKWNHSLGRIILKMNLGTGAKELDLTQNQALILLLFNEKSTFSFSEIKSSLRIGKNNSSI